MQTAGSRDRPVAVRSPEERVESGGGPLPSTERLDEARDIERDHPGVLSGAALGETVAGCRIEGRPRSVLIPVLDVAARLWFLRRRGRFAGAPPAAAAFFG